MKFSARDLLYVIETGKTVKVYGYKKWSAMKKEYFRRLEIFTQL